MNEATNNRILVLGATGKTGSRVARKLTDLGISIRTAARKGADIRFDWNEPSTFAAALRRVSCVYLVSPVMRTDFADVVSQFLDEAEGAGVKHVTYLSAYGVEHAPPEVALRAVELDLASRKSLSHSIVRPAWFMQNFSETFLKPVNDEIVVPCGTGVEAFVDAEDIASVAAFTLSDPVRHSGRAYAPTGPEALTFEKAARFISTTVGRRISYRDVDRDTWIKAMTAAGVPSEYGDVLRALTETIANGHGSRPNDDVLTVTGTPPIPLKDFAARAASEWR